GKGFTRGSVLGKIHRLGLKKAEEPKAKARPRVTATKPAAKGKGLPAAKVQPKATAKPPVARATAAAKPAPARSPAPVKPTLARSASKSKPTGAEGVAGKTKPVVVARAPEPSGPMPIWALGQCQCRWPIGNLLDPPGLFCAAVTDGSSWCPVHERMVYTGSARPRPDSSREQPRFAAAGGRSRF
ncbi:MAG: GcrA family cell cycle regulator, partial [Microvirga sp.]